MKKIILVICLVCAFILGACSTTVAHAEQTYPLKIWKHNDNGAMHTFCLVDDNTGVNYVVVSTECGGGYSVAVTPRLNADGSLYVSK